MLYNPFIFKKVYIIEITCNNILSLDTNLHLVYDYVFSNYLEFYELMIGNPKKYILPSISNKSDTCFIPFLNHLLIYEFCPLFKLLLNLDK